MPIARSLWGEIAFSRVIGAQDDTLGNVFGQRSAIHKRHGIERVL
jgi:hypothetical protein